MATQNIDGISGNSDRVKGEEVIFYTAFFHLQATFMFLAKTSVFFLVIALYWYLVMEHVVGWYESSAHLLICVGSLLLTVTQTRGGVLEKIISQ
jgi:hypothetical protein